MWSLRAQAWAIALLSSATIAGLFAAPTTEKPVVKYLHIKSAVKSRYAKTLVTSKIMNPAGAAQEVNYEVTVPESAFISNFTMLVDGKIMDGLVRERKAAKREYHTARQSGQTAGHVATATVRDSNQVRISVNVAAQSKVTFNLTYEELLVRVKGRYELAINVNPGQVVDELQIEVSIDEKRNITVLQVPEFRTTNEIDFEERDGISPYVTTNVSDHNVLIQYAPSKSEQERVGRNNGLQGKFVVRYDVERKDQPLNEILTKDGYFVHFFSPPEVQPLPKHVVFVLDVSGSMGGTKLRQLKEAMNAILNELNPQDYFNIIEFSNNAKILDLDIRNVLIRANPRRSVPAEVKSYPANAENIRIAKNAVNLMIDNGGTNIYDALNAAIEVTKRAAHLGDPSPIIIFLTDGEATVGETNVDVISNLVVADRQHYVPVFSLAFGDDADLKFLKRISLRSGAFARKIYEAADAALQLRDFYRLVASPLLKNVTFSYDNDTVNGSELTKQRFDLMFSGSEFVVAGKLRSQTKKVTGVVNSSQGNYHLMLPTPEVAPEPQPALVKEDDDNFLERLWAFLSIKQQLNKYEAWGASTDVREGEQKTPAQIAKEEALKLALQFSFVTPLTSLVVVERKEGEGETKIPEISVLDGPVSNGPAGSYSSGHRAGLMPAPAYRRPVFDHSHAFQSGPQPTQYMSHGVPSSEESESNLAELADFSLNSRIIAHPPQSASDFSIGFRRRSKPRTRIGYNPTSTPSIYGHSTTTPASTTVSTNGGKTRFSDISWIDEMRGLANATNYKVFSLKNETGSVKILNYNESANITGEACSNQSSTCRPFKKCVLEVFKNWDNPEIFIRDYKCDINYQGDVFLGVCCPTNEDHK